MTARQLAGSLQYQRWQVSATTASGAAHDPTGDTVQFAFTQNGQPPTSSTTWTAGEWAAGVTPPVAQLLIGPDGAVQLSRGLYDVWIKVTDNPEIPILNAGQLEID